MYIKTQTHTHPYKHSQTHSQIHIKAEEAGSRGYDIVSIRTFFWFCCCFSVSTWNPIVCLSFPFTNLLFATSWLGYIQHETSLQPLVVAFVYSLGSTQASKAKKNSFLSIFLCCCCCCFCCCFMTLVVDVVQKKSLIHIKWICTDRPRFATQQIFVARVVSSLL